MVSPDFSAALRIFYVLNGSGKFAITERGIDGESWSRIEIKAATWLDNLSGTFFEGCTIQGTNISHPRGKRTLIIFKSAKRDGIYV